MIGQANNAAVVSEGYTNMLPFILMAVAGVATGAMSGKRNKDNLDAQASLDKAGLNRSAVNAAERLNTVRVNADRTADKFRKDKLSLQIQSKERKAANEVQNAVLGISGVSAGDIMAAEQISSDIMSQDLDSKRDQIMMNMQAEFDNITNNLNVQAEDMSLQHRIRRKAAPSMGESVLGGLISGASAGAATL
jgi:uncharacterized protein (DUF885 family)